MIAQARLSRDLVVSYRALLVTAVSLLSTVRYRVPLSPTVARNIDAWLERVASDKTIPRGEVEPTTIKESFE
jgi:hypothetical protein